MTKAVRDRILKDANGDISDHLRNHIHLTNCIHLKNHMHKQSPILADRALTRDLIVLQRSRSLRDPSASPPSWHSPSVLDLLPKIGEKRSIIREGRRSVGNEQRMEGRRLSGSSPPLANVAPSKVAPDEDSDGNDGVAAVSERSGKSGVRDARKVRREESGRKSSRTDLLGGDEDALRDQEGYSLAHDVVSRGSQSKGRMNRQKGKHSQEVPLKTLSDQLNDIPVDSDDLASSKIHRNGRYSRQEKAGEEREASIHGQSAGLNKGKRRKFQGARRARAAPPSRDVGAHSEMSVASNSFTQGSVHPKHHMEVADDYGDQSVTRAPKNGCGIPWNWSRIHHRGKTILDIAGRSLSCGLADSGLRKGGMAPRGRDISGMPVASDHSSSSNKSDAEALPLLVEASASQGSTDNVHWAHDYSGELGIFADHLLKHDVDSDLASEARSGDQQKLRGSRHGRHQNLTQKYMPRTFRDLVGQNLVAQALSNAVIKGKVGLLYVFYGPHGTGKTSCARIFARALNCHSLEDPKPCGFCDSCIAHDMGKSRNIREVGPVGNFDFESIMHLLDKVSRSHLPSKYRVFIFDDCNSLSPECWSAIMKVIDRSPRRLVFVLVCSSLDVLPHTIISRCQKFLFPKLKDADIIYTLQWIASKEDIEIDKEALKLIASRSDGSLRDAEMTLEQLSLLGQTISVPLVQEMVGLISDEKLVDLLDLALSADTVHTVKNLRVVMETGVEPLALMSQLATVITDILAGSYDLTKERHKRKFFRRQPLSKEDMEKLRQALKTLSEAEKQLRISNDKLTWLTAALLQLAPDQQYMLPSSSADTSLNQSPFALNNAGGRGMARRGGEHSEMPGNERGLSANVRLENYKAGGSGDAVDNSMMTGIPIDRKRHAGPKLVPQRTLALTSDMFKVSDRHIPSKSSEAIEEIWLEVLGMIQISSVRHFLYQQGKLLSVSFGAAPTVQLMFSSYLTKSKGEEFRDHILHAFESVLGGPVTIEIRYDSRKDTSPGHLPQTLSTSKDGLTQMPTARHYDTTQRVPRNEEVNGFGNEAQLLHSESHEMGRNEIVEVPTSPREFEVADGNGTRMGEAGPSNKISTTSSISGRRKLGEQSQSQSIVRSKVSLAHVIQQAEGCSQRSSWSTRKAVSIAEKLEQENLRLEPSSKSLLCWKASRVTRRKLSRLKIRTRKPHSLLKLVSCGKCISSRSPR
ncbi:protein STICHEL-like 3 isoform X1 [Tripterygium wilfordii]|uniref:Protein STICHEL-like 3 isoform X1 n=1 Tax=Tripterygium wilfordii TaxID=458696 RepID=A0A7J7CQC4_TRIWF|nr:protein STICHEL-like 3 [Tripterygium wilfordii]KAF5736261.1 protein STICHEL-like 3 isoform X1 [Tripterygium wilfordii]